MRGVTACAERPREAGQFLLTRLMRGVTHVVAYGNFKITISTHTPHARRDPNI